MPQRELERQTGRLSLVVRLTGVVLAVATLCAAVFSAQYEFNEALSEDKEQGEIRARVLADHATRAVDSSSVMLKYIAKQLGDTQNALPPSSTNAALQQALVALPFVRSLAVLDEEGWILGSTQEAEIGRKANLQQLGVLPKPDAEVLGNYVPGRGLNTSSAPVVSQPGVGFIPLMRAVQTREGRTLYVMALLNPDSFSNFQTLTLNDVRDSAYLLSYDGQVLASSGDEALPPGGSAVRHAVFTRYLPESEHAVFVDDGISPGKQITAFRVSRTRSLVSVVEHRYADTQKRWTESMQWIVVAGVGAALFILVLTGLVNRALAARLRAHRQLDLARQDIVEKERDLRIIVSSVQELIFRTDADGRFNYVNDQWLALSGRSEEEAMGQSLVNLVEPEDRQAARNLFLADSDAGVRHASVRMRSQDGTLHRLDFAVVALHDDHQLVGFAGSAVDVTERYAAQLALEQQLEFVALLLEISPLPVATCDAEGRYVTVNRAWEEFTGHAREHVIGRSYSDVMSPEEAQEQMREDAELWKNGGNLRCETLLNHRDGSQRNVVVTKTLVKGSGRHVGNVLSTLMDVSEFREAQQAIQTARDAAEESSRAKSEFIANISHELRTPLQSILGFSELGALRGASQPKLAAMFSDIHTSGERMLALVNDLLDVSKIENAVGAIALERIDLRDVIEQVAREFRPQLAARQLQLTVDTGPRALVAKADPLRFSQVIRNVLANAVKFSPAGGTIAIVAEQHVAEREVCIRVRDQGVGIPEKELDRIFDAFVQSSITKDGSGGTGLGLAICKKIMTAHAGRIVAVNVPGGGAEFQISLPARVHLDKETTY